MEITELSSAAFWKGETEIRGIVADGDSRYRVRILRKGSQTFDYSCTKVDEDGNKVGLCSLSCTQGEDGLAMCGHGKLVLAEWLRREQDGRQRPVSTSQKVRFMVREYTNREVSRIMGAGEEGGVRLVPRLFFSRSQIRAQFQLSFPNGNRKMYPLTDLAAFAQAVESKSFVEYGKGAAFCHTLEAFEEESRPLVLMVAEWVGIYRAAGQQLRKGPWDAEPKIREMVLGKAGRERFFAAMEGRTLECEDYEKKSRLLQVRKENPLLQIVAERAGKDGVRLSLDKDIMAFEGEKHLFIADREAIYRCSGELTECLSVFMECMAMDQEAQDELFINDRDMPLFYERVLRKMEAFHLVRAKDLSLEQYRPEELKARFYFDSKGPGEISLRPELSYGEYSFHPLEKDKVPREICRDVPGEFRVSRLATAYFHYTEEESKDLVIRGDDEAIYRLVTQGIRQFMELGEVFVSDAFKKIRVLPPARVSVRVKTAQNWLELEADTGDLPKEELRAVLAAYEKKKPYYRMKNGDFLTLGDDGLLTMAKLAKTMDVEKDFLAAKTVRVPLYRAMFLDGMLKADRSIRFYRDQLFKAAVRGMREVEDSDYEIPKSLEPVLRNYQRVGFRWFRCLDAYGFGGILADEMGLGKTVQAIALLLDEKERGKSVSLIVCPASLVYNWENELSVFAPALRVLAVAGALGEREAMLRELKETGAAETDVVITSYDLLKRDIAFYQDMEFRFQIIDEAQYIKNSSTQAARAVKAIRARTRFALTGTPIENHLGELWSIFDFLMPGFLFTASKFKKIFEIPIVRDGDEEALARLRKMTGPFLLRRLKKDVLKELPDKLETVYYSNMEGEQKKLYLASAAALKERLASGQEKLEGEERIQVLAELMKLRQICCEPSLCFRGYKGGSAKLETCMELLENGTAAGHKILLFSQFASMLEILAKRLDKEKISYYMLTGATSKKDRIQMASSFQKDAVQVFLISLKAGGTGLNLASADIVIHYDPWWNVAAQNQATDRAHRIGQKNQVSVFKLITKHSIEENILKLQEQKKSLADTVVAEGVGKFGSLTREDFIRMLEET